MTDRFHIMCSVSHPRLKITVATIASKVIIAPFSCQKPFRRVDLGIAGQGRIVWFEETLKPLVARWTF